MFHLRAQNPLSMAYDKPNNRLLILNTGCRADGGLVGRQVDEVKLVAPFPATVFLPIASDPLAFLYIDDQTAYLQAADSSWKSFDPDAGTVGSVATQIPSLPFVDTQRFIVGLRDDTPGGDAGRSWGVYRVDKRAQLGGEILPGVFSAVNADSVYLLSTALVQ